MLTRQCNLVTGMDAILLSYMCLGVCGLSLQWCSSVGCNSQIFSSGIPVCGSFNWVFFQWCSSVPCKYSLGRPVVSQCTLDQPAAFQWHSCVHWNSQCKLAEGKGYYVTEKDPNDILVFYILRVYVFISSCTNRLVDTSFLVFFQILFTSLD